MDKYKVIFEGGSAKKGGQLMNFIGAGQALALITKTTELLSCEVMAIIAPNGDQITMDDLRRAADTEETA